MQLPERVRKNKVAIVISAMAVVILLLVGAVATLMISSGNDVTAASVAAPKVTSAQPSSPAATPAPITPTGVLTVPQTKPFNGDGWATLGTQLRLSYPSKSWWLNTPPEVDANRLDIVQKCPADTACPTITIVSRKSPSWGNTYGDDPVASWKQQACAQSVPDPLQGPVDTKMGGTAVKFYYQGCQDGTDNYFWYDQEGGVAIEAADNGDYDIDESLVQSVLAEVMWL